LALGRVVGKVRQERRCVRPGRRKGAAARLPRRGKRGTPLRHARKSRGTRASKAAMASLLFFFFVAHRRKGREGKGRDKIGKIGSTIIWNNLYFFLKFMNNL
jgi:hypothetical protein